MRNLAFLGLALAAACTENDGNSAAMVTINAPNQNQTIVQGFGVEVRVTADDPDDQAVVRVFIDIDGNSATTSDKTLLATLLEQDGQQLLYLWQTTAVAPGNYTFFYQVLETGKQPVEIAGTRTTILTAPTLTVGQSNRTIIAGTDVTIAFNATDTDGVATYAIYADRDCNLNTTDDQIVVASGLTATENSQVWSTAGVELGTYCIFITMDDGMNPLTVRSAGTITLASDTDLFFAPMPAPPLVPNASIVDQNPSSPDFYQELVFDGLSDTNGWDPAVDFGEIDVYALYVAQQPGFLQLVFELYSPFFDDIVRDDMYYSLALPGVRWNGMTGTLYLELFGMTSYGYFADDGGTFGDFVPVPLEVFFDQSLGDVGYLFFRIADSAFAFPTFTDDLSDFEVDAYIERLGSSPANSIDTTLPGVVRFRDDT